MFKKISSLVTKKDSKEQDELRAQIIGIIRTIADIGDDIEITAQTRLKDLGFDSIKFMNLILSFEDVINKDIEEIIDKIDNLALINTVQDVIDAVNDLR